MNLSQRRRRKSPGYNFKVQSFQKLSEQKLNFIGVAKKNKQSENPLFQRISNIQDIYKKNNLQIFKREQSQSRNQNQLQIKSPQNQQQKGRNNSQNQCNQGNNQLVNFGVQKRNSFSSYALSKTIDYNNSMLSQRQMKNYEKNFINKIQNLDNIQNQGNLEEFEQQNESPQESSDYLSFKRKKSYQTIKKSAEMKVESKLQSDMGSQNSSIIKNSDLLEQQIQNNSTNLFANKQLKQEYFEQFDNYKNNLNVKKSNSLVNQISDSVEQKRNQKQKKQKEILIFVNQNKKQNQRVYKRIPSENQLLELKEKSQYQHQQQQQQSFLQLKNDIIRTKHDTKKTSIILQGNNESEKNNIHNESFKKLKRGEHKYQNLDNGNIEIDDDQIPLERSKNVINQKNMQDYKYIQDSEQQKPFVIKSQSVHQLKQEKTGIKINGMGQIMNTYSQQSFSIASSPQGQWTNKSRRSSKSSFNQADLIDQIGRNQFIPKNQLSQFPKIPLKQSKINSFHDNGEEQKINIEKDENKQNNTHEKNILAPVFKPGIGTMIQNLFQHQGKNQTKIQKTKQFMEQKQKQNQQMVYSYQVAKKKYILPQNIQSLRLIENQQENLDEDEIKEKTPKSKIQLYIEKKKEIFRKQDMELEKQNQIQIGYMKNKKHVEYVKNYESLKYNSLHEFKREYIEARQTSIENEIQDLMGGKYIQLCENFFQIFLFSLDDNQTQIRKKLVEQYASKNLVKEIFDFFNELYIKRFINDIDQQNIFQENFKKIVGQYILSPNVYIDNLGGFKKIFRILDKIFISLPREAQLGINLEQFKQIYQTGKFKKFLINFFNDDLSAVKEELQEYNNSLNQKQFCLIKFTIWKILSRKRYLYPNFIAQILEKIENLRTLLFPQYFYVEEIIQKKFSIMVGQDQRLKLYLYKLKNQIEIDNFVNDFFDCITIYQNYNSLFKKYEYKVPFDERFFNIMEQLIQEFKPQGLENLKLFFLDVKLKFQIFKMEANIVKHTNEFIFGKKEFDEQKFDNFCDKIKINLQNLNTTQDQKQSDNLGIKELNQRVSQQNIRQKGFVFNDVYYYYNYLVLNIFAQKYRVLSVYDAVYLRKEFEIDDKQMQCFIKYLLKQIQKESVDFQNLNEYEKSDQILIQQIFLQKKFNQGQQVPQGFIQNLQGEIKKNISQDNNHLNNNINNMNISNKNLTEVIKDYIQQKNQGEGQKHDQNSNHNELNNKKNDISNQNLFQQKKQNIENQNERLPDFQLLLDSNSPSYKAFKDLLQFFYMASNLNQQI